MPGNAKDMTSGSPAKLITMFALPIMLGNIFQQMYTVADAAIVGQFAGADALGAIGSTDWLTWLLFGLITGFMQGMTILVSQRFGAGDMRGLRRCVSTIIYISLAVTAVFTLLGLTTIGAVLRLMKTPEVMYPMAYRYIFILYAGIPITAAYNVVAAILRAIGNSRAPLVAMVSASVVNIVLDLLFVAAFKWGVTGAVSATVISQGVAAAVCLYAAGRVSVLKYQKGEFVFAKEDTKELVRLGAPMAFQNTIISLGGIVLQTVINSLGTVFVSGFTATNKFYGLLECAAMSYGFGVCTYAGQNLGAKKYSRIKQGVHISALIGIGISVMITVLMLLFGRNCLRLFITDDADARVLDVAVRYLDYMSVPLVVLYFLHIYRSALQGIGDTFVPMLSGFAECVARTGTAIILVSLIGENGIYFAEPAAWAAAAVILVSTYYYRQGRLDALARA